MSEIFVLLPEMLQNVFADNCVAVVFLVAVIANLVLTKDIFVDGAEAEGAAEHYREAQAENDRCAEFDAVQSDAFNRKPRLMAYRLKPLIKKEGGVLVQRLPLLILSGCLFCGQDAFIATCPVHLCRR